MVEKADAGRDSCLAGTVEIDRDSNVGFVGAAGDGCGAHGQALSKSYWDASSIAPCRKGFAIFGE